MNLGLHTNQFPSGKWGFVGSIPVSFGAMVKADTADVMGGRAFHHPDTGELVRWKFPVFETEVQAIAFASSKGFSIQT